MLRYFMLCMESLDDVISVLFTITNSQVFYLLAINTIVLIVTMFVK
jgi:hypothetical protein